MMAFKLSVSCPTAALSSSLSSSLSTGPSFPAAESVHRPIILHSPERYPLCGVSFLFAVSLSRRTCRQIISPFYIKLSHGKWIGQIYTIVSLCCWDVNPDLPDSKAYDPYTVPQVLIAEGRDRDGQCPGKNRVEMDLPRCSVPSHHPTSILCPKLGMQKNT